MRKERSLVLLSRNAKQSSGNSNGCCATSLVARMILRRPAYSLTLCNHILRYLASHQGYGLCYGPDEEAVLWPWLLRKVSCWDAQTPYTAVWRAGKLPTVLRILGYSTEKWLEGDSKAAVPSTVPWDRLAHEAPQASCLGT